MSSAAVPISTELVNRLASFLKDYYREDLLELAERYPSEERSLWVEYRDLYQWDASFADDLREQPDTTLSHLEAALEAVDLPVATDFADAHVRVTDSTESMPRRTVSDLVADDLETYVALEGQIARVTGVNHRLSEAAFVCQRCGGDPIRIPQPRMAVDEPHECPACERSGPFTVDIADSDLVDQRKLKLEEPPEDRTRSEGESVPVFVEDDLCHHGGENGLADRAGERAVIFGIYRPDRSKLRGRSQSSEFSGWIEAVAVEFVEDDYTDIDIDAHRDTIEAFAAGEHGEPVDLVKQSIAPSLEITDELDTVLEAAVAWLFNAYRIDPPGLDQIRGDLHMALIGDPATGKSSVLSNLADIAPKCEFRSGSGITKVGLTAAAQQEEFAGTTEWTLRPGILPRANGGHCIIDEVDDVIDEKTKAIHDALEGDQMVKVDKAGIRADLPTRTALLASGNPIHGRYDPYESIPDQIDLDPALVSRMDVLLALKDDVEEERDRMVAEHWLDAYEELSSVEVANRTGEEAPEVEAVERPVPLEVLKTWVHHARETCFPTLSTEARDVLEAFYIEVRGLNDSESDPVPATPRSLGAGVRLATAFARVELSDTVEARHAERAVDISRQVVGLNFDPESGKFDVDRVETGTPKTQRDRIKSIRSVIEELAPEYSDGVPIEQVIEVASEAGIDESKVEHELENLRKAGETMEPKTGHVRLT